MIDPNEMTIYSINLVNSNDPMSIGNDMQCIVINIVKKNALAPVPSYPVHTKPKGEGGGHRPNARKIKVHSNNLSCLSSLQVHPDSNMKLEVFLSAHLSQSTTQSR